MKGSVARMLVTEYPALNARGEGVKARGPRAAHRGLTQEDGGEGVRCETRGGAARNTRASQSGPPFLCPALLPGARTHTPRPGALPDRPLTRAPASEAGRHSRLIHPFVLCLKAPLAWGGNRPQSSPNSPQAPEQRCGEALSGRAEGGGAGPPPPPPHPLRSRALRGGGQTPRQATTCFHTRSHTRLLSSVTRFRPPPPQWFCSPTEWRDPDRLPFLYIEEVIQTFPQETIQMGEEVAGETHIPVLHPAPCPPSRATGAKSLYLERAPGCAHR